ncbi:hypothetical protein [Kineosporia succinea]|uniref:Uncharacterized protein n=1 Tax=Kineosporia succinea TaxID=84632 RepID=A0ABT9P2M9_9ACTN|nr:hypothetical protein [Kineosporia succinea]MDP9826944.1 hypothetical protein [Kineosporia succinea]
MVNERPNPACDEFDRLKAVLHNAVRSCPESENPTEGPDFRAHALFRIAWVDQLNPAPCGTAEALV